MISFFRDVGRCCQELAWFSATLFSSVTVVFGISVLGAWIWTQPVGGTFICYLYLLLNQTLLLEKTQ